MGAEAGEVGREADELEDVAAIVARKLPGEPLGDVFGLRERALPEGSVGAVVDGSGVDILRHCAAVLLIPCCAA